MKAILLWLFQITGTEETRKKVIHTCEKTASHDSGYVHLEELLQRVGKMSRIHETEVCLPAATTLDNRIIEKKCSKLEIVFETSDEVILCAFETSKSAKESEINKTTKRRSCA